MALRNRARSTRLLVVSLVSASLITITIDYRGGDTGPLAAAGDATLTVITPLQEAVSKVTRPVGNFFSTLVHLPAIRRENEQYKETIAQLQQERSTELADRTYIQQLEDLLDLDESLGPRVETTAAYVVANAVSNFEWTVTIDKGSSDGVEVDMPVVAAAGLVGHVIRVTPSAAVVRLIIDPDSAVAGRLDVSEESGLLEGQGQGDLTMDLVRADAIVQPNEHVVTAGYRLLGGEAQSLYPPNILIGTVSRVLSDETALEKLVTVRPAVDFTALELVLVVLSSGTGA